MAISKLLPVIVWMLVILGFSVMRPGDGFGGLWPILGHFFEYAVLAALVFRALGPSQDVSQLAAYSIAASTLYGIAMEIVQLFVPYRSFSLLDMLVNLAGASTVLAYQAVSKAQRRGRQ